MFKVNLTLHKTSGDINSQEICSNNGKLTTKLNLVVMMAILCRLYTCHENIKKKYITPLSTQENMIPKYAKMTKT